MALTLYDAFVPTCRQILGAGAALVDRAEAHCTEHGIDAADMIGSRLAPDMFPVPFQVHSMAHHSAGAIDAVREGVFTPTGPGPDQSFATLKAMLTEADAALEAVDPAELEGMMGKTVMFKFGATEMPFTAENFLLSFSQPNFFFHATTFYDVLRHRGVALGKRAFLGMPRVGV
ncbi:MAG: DUF1993 domain-containing protein [Polymorphobacter sp.]